jgi:hypothetical protein
MQVHTQGAGLSSEKQNMVTHTDSEPHKRGKLEKSVTGVEGEGGGGGSSLA